MLFQKGKLKVRELEERDQNLLVKWLSDPVVLEFYEGRDSPFDLERVKAHFYHDEKDVTRCIIEFDGAEIGYAQYYPLDEQEREVYGYTGDESVIYGTDQLIGEIDYWNKGIGKVLVKAIVEYLAKEKQAGKVVMNPQAWNERAIRCYEKCGFKKVKLLPEHEWHEGKYNDCWVVEYRNDM
ncbi:GNAT family N-acetyltransferase [Domibacillus antri]|uniref:GNAT family N-acetyltransferase n=1 Tax=Domibacillus antri TaxID=1714264 RepID=A0A1Q8Q1N4_9BACI|nr:GNAT family N-acetyltransferase [Domibacillus antri]OLN21253.1 GNAT family N-acetyltransferase [Domibacillus antri]